MTENDVWAELPKENIRRGGKWIETRILNSGLCTNPWFQECGPLVIKNNELLVFDTDLIGCYSMCADISRIWFIGDGEPVVGQRSLLSIAHDYIMKDIRISKPEVSFQELCELGHQLLFKFIQQRYESKYHEVGLRDERPLIKYPIDWEERGYHVLLQSESDTSLMPI